MNLSKVKWLVQDRMIVGTSYENLPDIIRNMGMECTILKYGSTYEMMEGIGPKLPSDHSCVTPYTTVDIGRHMKRYFGMYLNEESLKYHVYLSNLGLPNSAYLNGDALLTTYQQFKAAPLHWYSLFPGADSIFVRPDSGMKIFTGCVIPKTDIELHLNYLDTTAVNPESLIWISSSKYFWDETRFIICDGEVIDGSRYYKGSFINLEDAFVEDKEFPLELWDLAKEVAEAKWHPDPVFTVDICATTSGPKIVEVNSFSCAGWYACDAEKVVKAISETTLKLYEEQYG